MAMLNISDNSFNSWILTDQEIIQGSILNTTQKQVIQNLISDYAHRRLNLTFSPENMQAEAELQGNIRALQNLLIMSEAAEKASQNGSNSTNTLGA
jgi:hypothetical protein